MFFSFFGSGARATFRDSKSARPSASSFHLFPMCAFTLHKYILYEWNFSNLSFAPLHHTFGRHSWGWGRILYPIRSAGFHSCLRVISHEQISDFMNENKYTKNDPIFTRKSAIFGYNISILGSSLNALVELQTRFPGLLE